jgi:hypothetical protein
MFMAESGVRSHGSRVRGQKTFDCSAADETMNGEAHISSAESRAVFHPIRPLRIQPAESVALPGMKCIIRARLAA